MYQPTARTLPVPALVSGALALILSVGCLPDLGQDDCVSADECPSGRCFGGICVPLGADSSPSPADMGSGPAIEVCNGVDDDLDGVVDDEAICPELPESETRCVDGACVYSCPEGVFDADRNPQNGCQRGCELADISMAFIGDIEVDQQQLVMAATALSTLVLYRDRESADEIGLKGFNYLHDTDGRNVWGPFNANLGTFDRPAVVPYGVGEWIVGARVVDGRQVYHDAQVAIMRINAAGAVASHHPMTVPGATVTGWPALALSTDRTLAVAAEAFDARQATAALFTGPVDDLPASGTLSPLGEPRPVGALGPAVFATPAGFAVLTTAGGEAPVIIDQRVAADGSPSDRAEAPAPAAPSGRLSVAPGTGYWAVESEGGVISGELDREVADQPGIVGALHGPAMVDDVAVVRLPRGPAVVYRASASIRIAFAEAGTWREYTLPAPDGPVLGVAAAAVGGELRVAWVSREADDPQQQALHFSTQACF